MAASKRYVSGTWCNHSQIYKSTIEPKSNRVSYNNHNELSSSEGSKDWEGQVVSSSED